MSKSKRLKKQKEEKDFQEFAKAFARDMQQGPKVNKVALAVNYEIHKGRRR